MARITTSAPQEVNPLSGIKDRRLTSILQTDTSKVVDENGERKVVSVPFTSPENLRQTKAEVLFIGEMFDAEETPKPYNKKAPKDKSEDATSNKTELRSNHQGSVVSFDDTAKIRKNKKSDCRRKNANIFLKEDVIYRSEEITPEQSALLDRPNFGQYPAEQGLSDDKGTANPSNRERSFDFKSRKRSWKNQAINERRQIGLH